MNKVVDDYIHAMNMVKEVEDGPVSKFSDETRCFAALVRAVDDYHRETQKRADRLQAELTEAKGKLAGIKTIRRDHGSNGWVVEYGFLENLTHKIRFSESVSMEQVQAVIMALFYDGFLQVEDWRKNG